MAGSGGGERAVSTLADPAMKHDLGARQSLGSASSEITTLREAIEWVTA